MAIEEPRLREIEALLAYRENVARVPAEILLGGVRIDEPVESQFQVCGTCERSQGDYRSMSPTPVEAVEDNSRHDAWKAYLAGWILHYPCRLELRCQKQWLDPDCRTYYLRIQFLYPDEKDSRDETSPVPGAEDRLGLWPPSRLPDENTPRWIRANVTYHLGHELDEHLLFDNNKVFDPHHHSAYTCEACIAREQALAAVPELIAEVRELTTMRARMEALATDLTSHNSNVGMYVAGEIRRRLRKP